MSTRKQTKGFLLGALAGGVIGSVTALLLAPKAGKELRQDISEGAQKVGGATAKVAGQVTDTTVSIAKQIGGQAAEFAGKTKLAATSVVSSVKGWNKSEGGQGIVINVKDTDAGLETSAIDAVEAGETEAAVSKEQ
ncbi:YtxH domain-containing protein [Paenibacillus arenilitoris]|uniref:YtxH domain-containing protein n=1 Tax=Paenibacillus arenilitoris TaxID=2772299 RepID=A0A927CHA8_9BACL|nr:YtxH domain-containing protein [Paenibacillus arenilitoris]MBD2867525.1 YtxH domain-containing protein [Paenibacillus arenilitoris]